MEHRNPRGGHPHPPETAPACTRTRLISGPCTPRHNLHTPTRFQGALPSALGAPAGEVTRGVASTHTRALSKNPGSWIAVVALPTTSSSLLLLHTPVCPKPPRWTSDAQLSQDFLSPRNSPKLSRRTPSDVSHPQDSLSPSDHLLYISSTFRR